MRHFIKNTCRIIFSDFYKNVYDRSAIKKNILVRSVVANKQVSFNFLKYNMENLFQLDFDINSFHFLH